ncbi:type VI secretion system baseplate subunit TssF [Janthinobacterium fluminis]|uniref:Type VI secretion system baseplate subunit TssF n=1 Tax=Janthinobacterium fluminis TaxID=2987524 RepID=A0ABT5JVC6_9BURK|nr:type VI secretion system baseplate subunit TssF [Janthinobacterium fluminis]MDC8756678.1 type VI secretion system baseplate subunit TssF [Janthinobacterium fluminis]
MDKFQPHYARELGFFRRFSREFAERYPKIAANLLMHGESSEDPHVERMIQAFAFLTARISKRLDDDYPQLTEALLETLYPHYLRAFPSCAIARFDGAAAGERAATIPRATVMKSAKVRNVKCTFKSIYEVSIAPLSIAEARFHPHIAAPPSMPLPAGVSASLRIAVQAGSAEQAGPRRLRVFIDGDPSFCAALRDALFLHTASAYVEAGGDGKWLALDAIPVTAVGFAEADALIPFSARSHPAYRLLTEYFCFPDKFNFFDIELARLAAVLPPGCRDFSLHLALKGIPADSNRARILSALSPKNLLLGCTPVVNLFEQAGNPLDVTHMKSEYTLLADPARAYAYEIHSIVAAQIKKDTADGSAGTPFRPFYALHAGEQPDQNSHYWVTRRDDMVAATSPGHETKIAFVDSDFNPMLPETATLSTTLLCSNRDLPCALAVGLPDGDLEAGGDLARAPIHFLRKPSAPQRFEAGRGAHWRLISHLSLNFRSLCEAGLADFRKMLSLHDLPQSATSQRQIMGITGLAHEAVMSWVEGKPHAFLMPGIAIRMTLDEEAFVGSGVHAFAQLMDQFLALYGQINLSTQLIILSHKTGEELLRCQPRSPMPGEPA